MIPHLKHLNIKFDPTEPAQLIASRVGQSIDFGDFPACEKKGDNIKRYIFSCTSQGLKILLLWLGTIVPSLVQIQIEVSDFQKKNVPLAILFFFFKSKTQSSKCLRFLQYTNMVALLNFTDLI